MISEEFFEQNQNSTGNIITTPTVEAPAQPSSEITDSVSEARVNPEKEYPHQEHHPDKWEPLRAIVREKQTIEARVIKWQRNGLEMELVSSPVAGISSVRAFMPNDNIDHDSKRNIANYFGKTLRVKLTSVKAHPNTPAPAIIVSHRAVLDEEAHSAGTETVKKIKVGDIIPVKVKSFDHDNIILDMGAGVEAVILLRDLSWQRVAHPYEVVKRGETVSAKVLSLDRGRCQVRLGIRQLTADPDLAKYGEYNPGDTQNGVVKSIENFGAELELPNGLIAFLPASEIAWHRFGAISELLTLGDEVPVKLLTIDYNDRRITVSRKQLIDDPAQAIANTFKPGTDHDGTIKEVNRGGVVVTLALGVEGFIPRRELSHDRIERLEDVFKIGKPLEGLRVIEFNRNGRGNDNHGAVRITLSLIAAEREAQRTTLKEYRPTSRASSYSLADSLASLKEKLAQQEREQ